MKSVIQNEKTCIICGSPYVEEHHIFYGENRKNSEKWGMKVYLCPEHHRGDTGVHHNKKLDERLKKNAEHIYIETVGTKEEFIEIFGRNYI